MYRIYDTPAAIRRVQDYLREAGNNEIFVAPTGVYDENTRLSVIDFQNKNGFEATGVVNRITFDKLFSDYQFLRAVRQISEGLDSFIKFPILPGTHNDAMMHINRTLARLLDYYGYSHNIRDSNFYSKATEDGLEIMEDIYLLDRHNYIDEELYYRMIKDHDSIGNFNANFS